jgi:hypothetical protein
MYTVLRITCESESERSDLVKIGERMEARKKGSFLGLRKGANWFACSAAKSADIDTHGAEILETIKLFTAEIRDANNLAFRVTIDTAIEPEDFGSAPYSSFGIANKALKVIADSGIGIEFTVYRP